MPPTDPFAPSDDVGTIRRTPRVPTLDGTHLNWLIEQFVTDRRTRLDNQITVDTYACRLRWFTQWWLEAGPVRAWLLQAPDFVAFERYLRSAISPSTERALSWNYRNGIMFTLREALRWAYDTGYTERDYALWIPNAHGGKPVRKAADIKALTKLLLEAGNGRSRTRDRAMIAMLIGMGLRRGEISNLKVEDLVFEPDRSGHARVYGKRTSANKTGERDAAFDAATGEIVLEHIDAKRYTSGPLFRNKYGGRLTPGGVHQAVKAIIHRARLWKEIQACHDLRRGFTTYYARNKPGADSADLRRRQLGHARYSQTTDYTLYDVDDIRQDLISPVSLISGLISGLVDIRPPL